MTTGVLREWVGGSGPKHTCTHCEQGLVLGRFTSWTMLVKPKLIPKTLPRQRDDATASSRSLYSFLLISVPFS